ncbi:sulfatase [Chloroflexota bacterium]
MDSTRLSRRDLVKLLGLAPLLLVNSRRQNRSGALLENRPPPNILVFLFDAWSARHMSLYGYPRQTTPHLERLAQNAVVFHRHYAGGNFTCPGTTSLLTGTYPWTNRGFNLGGKLEDIFLEQNIFALLNSSYNTFAYTHNMLVQMLLHQFSDHIDDLSNISKLTSISHGYADRYLSNDFFSASQGEELILRRAEIPPSSLFLSRIDRQARYQSQESLYNSYKDIYPVCVPGSGFNPRYLTFTLETAIDWTLAQCSEQPSPFFGYVHLLPPHDPYCTRQEFYGRFHDNWQAIEKPEHHFSNNKSSEFLNVNRQAYDEFILYIDAEFARLFNHLDNSGVLDNTYLILTSDHGELFERGIWAHKTPTLYEGLIHIPLLVWGPGIQRRQDVFTLTSCVDILPTVMSLTGRRTPPWCQGRILPHLGGLDENERSVFAIEAKENSMNRPLRKATFAIIRGRYKLIHYRGYEQFHEIDELYDLVNDPEEMDDISAQEPTHVIAMRIELLQSLKKADIQ